MREEIYFKINSDLGKVAKDAENVTKEIEKVPKSAKKASKGISEFGKSFKAITKASGIVFLLDKAIRLFKDTLGKNQKVIDFFNIAMNSLSIAFSDLFTFLENNIGTVIGYFKDIFDDPVQSMKNFGMALIDNVIERLMSFLDVIGFLSSAVEKVFNRDFTGAMADVKNAGKEMVDVWTGVDNTFDKVSTTVDKATTAIGKYTKSTIKKAKAITETSKAAERSASILAGINKQFQKEALIQEELIDNELISIEKRQDALEELTRLTNDNNAANIAAQELQVKNAKIAVQLNGSDENKIKLKEEENILMDVMATALATENELFDKKIKINNDWNKEQQKTVKKTTEVTKDNTQEQLKAFGNLAGALSGLAGDNKELAAASAIIDTYAGATKAFQQGGTVGFVTGAAIIAAGLSNVQKIYDTDVGSGGVYDPSLPSACAFIP